MVAQVLAYMAYAVILTACAILFIGAAYCFFKTLKESFTYKNK